MKEILRKGNERIYHLTWEDRSDRQRYKQNPIFPINTYSPWEGDLDFIKHYEMIKDNTLVDVYRCYELWLISSQLRGVKGSVLEVGVWRGGTGVLLALSYSYDTDVFLCDTFTGVVKASEADSVYKGGEHSDTSINIVEDLIEKSGVSNCHIITGIFPEESSNLIPETEFKLCHIDVDVYQSAKDIFNWVWPKMIQGGIVVFDDYGFGACEGITTLVNELSNNTKNAFKLYNINGHGIIIKSPF